MEELENKVYLGDGVYAGHDGYQIWLYTDNGMSITNKIALDPSVLAVFLEYVKSLKQENNNDAG